MMELSHYGLALQESTLDLMKGSTILLISCPENVDVISSICNCLAYNRAKITFLDQYLDSNNGKLYIRIQFEPEANKDRIEEIKESLSILATKYHMDWKLTTELKTKRMAVFVSKMDQHLMELIFATKSKEIPAKIEMVISNHQDLKETAEHYGIPYYYIPIMPKSKAEAEQKAIEILKGKVDFIVLARYMQILTPNFVSEFKNRIINIHHSLLPAFIGANPYERAHERGVKLIGATAHYVTDELDAGPIIHQDIRPVAHHHTVKDLKTLGSHIEKSVLAKAVSLHAEDKIIIQENKTIIF